MLTEEVMPKTDWFSRGILSGFIASIAMLVVFFVAYGIALLLAGSASSPQATVSQIMMTAWLYNLTHNPATDLAQRSLYFSMGAHLTIGMMLAILYGYFIEPRLTGPDWARGVLYSSVPWFLSVTVFFPALGGGIFGVNLGAGPLPFLGNLILHLVYGATLGLIYGPFGDGLPGVEEASTEENQRAMREAEQMAAKGIIGGLVCGFAAGVVQGVVVPSQETLAGGASPFLTVLGLTLLGGAFGAFLGSIFGLPSVSHETST